MTQKTASLPSVTSPASALTAEQARFAALLDGQYDYAFTKGTIVQGKVLYTDANYAYIDVGAKTSARIHIKELTGRGVQFSDELTPGESYEFYILREEDEDGQLSLSRRKVAQALAWKQMQVLMDAEEVLECEVMSLVKGGLLVDVQGLRGFVPSSHIRNRNGMLEDLVGQTLPFKILAVDSNRNNIILSHRKAVPEQTVEQKRDAMELLQPGDVKEGDVVRLTDFGAFVDLGGVDGLLPLSQMSWRWVEHPSDVLKVGDRVKVEIIGVDAERNRVSLSIKSLQNDPWEEVTKTMSYGLQVEGKVTRIKSFGAFVEIFTGVEALLPMRDLNDYEYRSKSHIEPGHTVSTFINRFNPEERRISLSFIEPPALHAPQEQPAGSAPVAGEQDLDWVTE